MLLALSFACLLVAAWALRSPWRAAKARAHGDKIKKDDAPTTPPNPYGEE